MARRGQFNEAIEAAISAVAAEPPHESANAALIEVYIAEGNVSEAAREIESYETLLQVELDQATFRPASSAPRPE